MSVRVLLAEDQTMVREALAALLGLEDGIEVVAQAAGGDEAPAFARQLKPDIALLDIETGERVVDPGLAATALATGPSPLTARETDVLRAAREPVSVADPGARLHLSPGTVRNHLSSAIQKLGARNRADAVAIADGKGRL